MKSKAEKSTSKVCKIVCALFFILATLGCTSENTSDRIELIEKQKISLADLAPTPANAKKIYYNLPSPHEVATFLLDETGTEFEPNLLNDVFNLVKYVSNKSMALNLGIYSTDLSYLAIYNQNHEILGYFSNVKKLSKDLGILEAIGEKTLNKLKDNYSNRDFVFNTICEAFLESNEYLRNNDREEILAMILVGGWIEGMFLATQLSEKSLSKRPDLVEKIVNQHTTLLMMLEYFGRLSQDNNMVHIKKQLIQLNNYFNKIIIQKPSENDYLQFCNTIVSMRESFTKLS